MATVIPFKRPVAAQRADGVMAAVNIAARRLGYSESIAYRAARSAKRRFLDGAGSAAAVVASATAELRSEASPEVA